MRVREYMAFYSISETFKCNMFVHQRGGGVCKLCKIVCVCVRLCMFFTVGLSIQNKVEGVEQRLQPGPYDNITIQRQELRETPIDQSRCPFYGSLQCKASCSSSPWSLGSRDSTETLSLIIISAISVNDQN